MSHLPGLDSPSTRRRQDAGASRGGPGARALLVLAGLLAAAPLLPHDFWLAPASFRPAADEPIRVGLRVGEGFRGDAVPWNPSLVQRFAVVGPEGERSLLPTGGSRPAAIGTPVSGSARWIVYQSQGSKVELSEPVFEAYLEAEGLVSILAKRRLPGARPRGRREAFSRHAKALLCPPEAGTRPADRPLVARLGLELELIAEDDLCAVRTGEELALEVRFRGQPVPDLQVVALPRDAPAQTQVARTDGAGRVRLRLERSGVWLVKAVHMIEAPPESGVDWASLWATLTFEIP